MSESSRRSARILAFKIAYQREQIGYNPAGESLLLKNSNLSLEMIDFTKTLTESLKKNREQIDQLIEENLINWKKSRLAGSLNALLQIAVTELQIGQNPNEGVILNEALEICRQCIGEDAIKICNGVLDAIWKTR